MTTFFYLLCARLDYNQSRPFYQLNMFEAAISLQTIKQSFPLAQK